MRNHEAGGGIVPLLLILFIGLKLTGFIDWGWVWVLSPLWISACIGVLTLGIVLVFNSFIRGRK